MQKILYFFYFCLLLIVRTYFYFLAFCIIPTDNVIFLAGKKEKNTQKLNDSIVYQ